MSNIVKTCEIHGDLNETQVIKEKNNQYKTGYYFRCKPCRSERAWKDGIICKKHGRLEVEDVKSNGRCKKCHRESSNSKRDANREWFNARLAQDRIDNPEKWKERRKREYQNSLKNHGAQRVVREILRMHGLTQSQYDKMFEEQGHKCKICNLTETRRGRTKGTTARLVVDHCHKTQKVRGLLCAKCNLMIGYANDCLDILESAIIYLQEFSE